LNNSTAAALAIINPFSVLEEIAQLPSPDSLSRSERNDTMADRTRSNEIAATLNRELARWAAVGAPVVAETRVFAAPREYVVGLLVPGTRNPFLHMTVCVVQGHRWGDQAMQDIKALANAVLPVPVAFGARALFGPNQDVPVRLAEIRDTLKKELLDDFYRKYFEPLPGEEGRLTQAFHVSIKKVLAEADALGECELPVMFAKVVGVDQFLWRSDGRTGE